MSSFKEKLDQTVHHFKQAVANANNNKTVLSEIRIRFLGRKGEFSTLLDLFKNLTIEEKRAYGPLLQAEKKVCEDILSQAETVVEKKAIEDSIKKAESFDPTAYIYKPSAGLHPLSIIEHTVIDICTNMGFSVAYGPEVEKEWYNFDALNIPESHPARDFWDTIWIDVPDLLLRTHTSPVQVRTLEALNKPLSIIAPGRCYRHEATDATHDFQFMQLEGLVLGKDISMSNLLATVKDIMSTFFNKPDLALRIRPSYFPFVEPGIEIDITCPFCKNGCSVCKKSTFIEMGGAGMVHPHVLKSAHIDPQFTGFAFGFGLTRLAMLYYQVPDLRLFYANEYNFLRQF